MQRSRPYDRLAASVDTPMYVVTTAHAGERAGCLVGFSVQCGIEPTRHLVCLSKANRTFEVARSADALVVHALHDGDHALAALFGEQTAYDHDKFTSCAWRDGPGGAPVLLGCDWFGGPIVQRVDFGDHVGHVVEVSDHGDASRATEPRLCFQQVRDLEAGNPA